MVCGLQHNLITKVLSSKWILLVRWNEDKFCCIICFLQSQYLSFMYSNICFLVWKSTPSRSFLYTLRTVLNYNLKLNIWGFWVNAYFAIKQKLTSYHWLLTTLALSFLDFKIFFFKSIYMQWYVLLCLFILMLGRRVHKKRKYER